MIWPNARMPTGQERQRVRNGAQTTDMDCCTSQYICCDHTLCNRCESIIPTTRSIQIDQDFSSIAAALLRLYDYQTRQMLRVRSKPEHRSHFCLALSAAVRSTIILSSQAHSDMQRGIAHTAHPAPPATFAGNVAPTALFAIQIRYVSGRSHVHDRAGHAGGPVGYHDYRSVWLSRKASTAGGKPGDARYHSYHVHPCFWLRHDMHHAQVVRQ